MDFSNVERNNLCLRGCRFVLIPSLVFYALSEFMPDRGTLTFTLVLLSLLICFKFWNQTVKKRVDASTGLNLLSSLFFLLSIGELLIAFSFISFNFGSSFAAVKSSFFVFGLIVFSIFWLVPFVIFNVILEHYEE